MPRTTTKLQIDQGVIIPASAAAGRVLTSDASGNGTWQTVGSGPPSGTAGGDLAGTYPNPGIAAGVIVNVDVSATAAIALNKLNNARAFAMAVS